MLETIKNVICEFIDIDPDDITPESNLRTDIGLNSLDCVSLAQELENEYDIEIPNADLSKFKTVNDVIQFLEKKINRIYIIIKLKTPDEVFLQPSVFLLFSLIYIFKMYQ